VRFVLKRTEIDSDLFSRRVCVNWPEQKQHESRPQITTYFFNTVIEFAFMAFAIFLMVRQIIRSERKPEVVSIKCSYCLYKVR